MDRELTPLRRLGARLAEVQDADAATSSVRARARAAFLSSAKPGRVKPATYGLPALAIVVLAAALASAWPRQTADGRRSPQAALAMTGEPRSLAAPNESPLPVHFADGSEVTLAASGRARIDQRSLEGASVALERGQLHAKIRHRADTAWRFAAGPYDVRVVGTSFALSWDPTSGSMELGLEEGSVIVTGCNVERRVSAGENLRVHCDRFAEASSPTPSARLDPIPAADLAPAPDRLSAPSPSAPKRVEVPSAALVAPPSWRELTAAARYPEAYAAARREGFETIAREASASDLVGIADAARLTQHVGESDALLTAVRRRFPGSPHAAVAAFMLGRSAMDGPSAYRDAAAWFETALREQPNGALAREAAGLAVDASDRAGDAPRARAAATVYLQRYPTGPHAELAHRVLARGASEQR